jgi:hypothetical protein
VLRPGGSLVVCDVHHEHVALRSMPRVRTTAGESAFLPAHRHRASDYLNAAASEPSVNTGSEPCNLAAALPLGFQVRS